MSIKTKTEDQKNALVLAILYTIIIGIGMYISLHWAGYQYGNPKFVRVLFWVEIVLLALSLFWVKTYYSWTSIGLAKITNKKELLWFFPPATLIIYIILVFLSNIKIQDGDFGLFILVGLTTLLVGISEEIVYRGVVLRSFFKNKNVWIAMIISAVLFSLLHAVNYFGGVSINGMFSQLLGTFILGALFFAPIAIRLGSLWPLIIFHWLWDFILIGSQLTTNGIPAEFQFFSKLLFIEGILLWISIWKFPPKWIKNKKQT